MIADRPPSAPAATADKLWSIILAVLVHAALAAFLFIGVKWEMKPPPMLEVDLIGAPQPETRPAAPAPRAPEPKPEPPKPEPKPEPPPPPPPPPKPEPKPEPKPAPKPEPKPVPPPPKPEPKPEPKPVPPPPKPEPKPEPPPPPKPEPKPEPPPPPKPEPKPEPPPKPEPKPEPPPPPKPEPAPEPMLPDMSKMLEQEMRRAQAASARSSAEMGEYINMIRLHVRSQLVVPPGLVGNPEARFRVTQRPDGSVASIELTRSSGNPALDAAIERALRNASPLPLPKNTALFERVLDLTFKPLAE